MSSTINTSGKSQDLIPISRGSGNDLEKWLITIRQIKKWDPWFWKDFIDSISSQVSQLPQGDAELEDLDNALEEKSWDLWANMDLPYDQRLERLWNHWIHEAAIDRDESYTNCVELESSYNEAVKLLKTFLSKIDFAIAHIDEVDFTKGGTLERFVDFLDKKEFIDLISGIDKLKKELLQAWVDMWWKRRLLKYAPSSEWWATYFIKRIGASLNINKTRGVNERTFLSMIWWMLDFTNKSGPGRREKLRKELILIRAKWAEEFGELTSKRDTLRSGFDDYYWEFRNNAFSSANDEHYGPNLAVA